MEKTDGNEHTGSLLLEERANELYKQIKWRNKKQEKAEILKSKTETCMCGQLWVYEDPFFARAFSRCSDEYCFMNMKRQI